MSNTSSSPLVTVIVITYNQGKTIAQTIESILCQKCTFSFELVIGDDCSTDETSEICKDFWHRYPNIIRLITHKENIGLIGNYAKVISAATGKYIAQCAGDDYWTDEKKLQKQVGFLEAHPDHGVIRTGGYILNTRTDQLEEHDSHSTAEGDVFKIAKQGTIAAAASICFKRDLLKYIDFNEFIKRGFSMEDYPMQVIFARHTFFGYLPDRTYVYRRISGSLSNPKLNENYVNYIKGLFAVKKYLNELFGKEYPIDIVEEENKVYLAELRVAILQFNYKNTIILRKFLIKNKSRSNLLKYTNNRFLFCLFHFYYLIKNIN